MGNFYIGNKITGIFSSDSIGSKKDLSGYRIEKYDDTLYLMYDGENRVREIKDLVPRGTNTPERVTLVPIGDESENLIDQFSNEHDDDNESIYQLDYIDGNILVILYVYDRIMRMENETQRMIIHLHPADEENILGKDGPAGIHADKLEDIPDILSDLFITGRSIIVQPYSNKPGNYTLYGNRFRGTLKMEVPGIYALERLTRSTGREKIFGTTQIFGNIRFMLADPASREAGNKNAEIKTTKSNDIFDAWDQFMSYYSVKYANDLQKYFFPYSSARVGGDDYIIFELTAKVEREEINDVEFEFISEALISDETPLPTDYRTALAFKETNYRDPVYVGRILDDGEGTSLSFRIPERLISHLGDIKESGGVIYVSNFSLENQRRRRRRILDEVNSKTNRLANTIIRLAEPDVYDPLDGTSKKPLNDETLMKMFGRNDIILNQNYKDAMYMAFNTPDIALIQGPPGTGKTTLISGIVSRLESEGNNVHILTSSEQHVALENVVERLSGHGMVPPIITSPKHDEDAQNEENKFFENIKNFQESVRKSCDAYLDEHKGEDHFSDHLTNAITAIQRIRASDYSLDVIGSNMDDLEKSIDGMGLKSKLDSELLRLRVLMNGDSIKDSDTDPKDSLLMEIIDSQKTTLDDYINDNGYRQFRHLKITLERMGLKELLPNKTLSETMGSDDKERIAYVFPAFTDYLERLKEECLPDKNKNPGGSNVKKIIETIFISIFINAEPEFDDLYEIIENFRFRINDMLAIADIVKKYTTVVGSTCAQANKSTNYVTMSADKYDYVIVDEAARANPVDLMMPIMMGKARVLLVGDQYQLPHYIEEDVMKHFQEDPQGYSSLKEGILKKSLFQLLFDNLEKAHADGRLTFRRTLMLEEQHRMHPTISNFISKEFYGGKLISGKETESYVNNYGVFKGKSIAYVHIPHSEGHEITVGGGKKHRPAERKKIIKILKDIVNKNSDDLPSVGVMSFYKEQTRLLNEEIEDMPDNIRAHIFCDTVDSFQGREFDIVLLSGVRSNALHNTGFIKTSSSRINVALSRARRLLVFVGDIETFSAIDHFNAFFDYVRRGHGYCE